MWCAVCATAHHAAAALSSTPGVCLGPGRCPGRMQQVLLEPPAADAHQSAGRLPASSTGRVGEFGLLALVTSRRHAGHVKAAFATSLCTSCASHPIAIAHCVVQLSCKDTSTGTASQAQQHSSRPQQTHAGCSHAHPGALVYGKHVPPISQTQRTHRTRTWVHTKHAHITAIRARRALWCHCMRHRMPSS